MFPISISGPNAVGIMILGSMIFFIVFCAATSLFEWLWNITIPDIFKTRPITFWEAFRLLIMGAMLSSGAFIRFNFGG